MSKKGRGGKKKAPGRPRKLELMPSTTDDEEEVEEEALVTEEEEAAAEDHVPVMVEEQSCGLHISSVQVCWTRSYSFPHKSLDSSEDLASC